jgi:mono/diheme cytochrome c family protein
MTSFIPFLDGKNCRMSRTRAALLTVASALVCTVSAGAYAAEPGNADLISRGAYLAKAADCIACHTAKKSEPFAGGVPFATPFGIVYSTNITPDNAHGIGTFSDQDFISAVREGVSKDGKRLYPAMPYTSYTKLSDDDILAIRAYLKTIAPLAVTPPANTLPFPFNQRWTLMFWNILNFDDGRFKPDATKDAEWNRGAYLATALGHCQECHTPRNVMEGLSAKNLAGAQLGNWTAFNITSDPVAGIGSWSEADIAAYLRDGAAPGKANAAGPMAEVVENSTRFMSDSDLHALARYLKSVQAQKAGDSVSRFDAGTPVTSEVDVRGKLPAALMAGGPVSGKALFVGNCASCHAATGAGIGGSALGNYPSLLHNSVVGSSNAGNLAMVMLHGVSRETNHGHVFMPEFGSQLSDQDVSMLVGYLTKQFGNGATITPEQVHKLR